MKNQAARQRFARVVRDGGAGTAPFRIVISSFLIVDARASSDFDDVPERLADADPIAQPERASVGGTIRHDVRGAELEEANQHALNTDTP